MGSQNRHRTKAERIREFADSIADGEYPEWIVIAIFYEALHLIEMMLAAKSRHATSHEQRRRVLRDQYPEMLRYYKPLYNFSLLCRYRFQMVSDSDVNAVEDNLGQLAALIETEINST